MIRIHDTIEFSDLEFALRVRPIGDVATIDVFPEGFELEPDYDDLGNFRKVVRKVTKAVGKVAKKAFKGLKKGFVKFAPILGILAQVLNVIPGLGIVVGIAINVGAAAMKARAAKKEMKKGEKAEEAAAAAEIQALDAEADQATIDAYTKGESFFTSKYGMTRENFMALSPKGRYDFLMGAVYDTNVNRFMAKGVTRDGFLTMSIDDQTALLAQMNAEGGLTTSEQAIAAMDEGSTPLALIAIGAGALAIILVVYLLTRKK